MAIDFGDDKEWYRHYFLIENNRERDDYAPLIAMTRALRQRGAAFDQATHDVLDVDEWLRAFAALSLSGAGDNYNAGAQHNAIFYQRPSDGKMLLFPFDMDFAFINAPTSALSQNPELSRLRQNPDNEHAFLGHLQDIVSTSFNTAYMERWVDHYDQLLPGQNLSSILNWIQQRAAFVLSSMPAQTPFQITADTLTVDTPTVQLQGQGWVNVRQLRLAGATQALDVQWLSPTSWQAQVPVDTGSQVLTIEAFDFQGDLIGSDTVSVTSSFVNSVAESLRVTEINYNPAAPSPSELLVNPTLDNNDFEFIELQNIGAAPINLLNYHWTSGIDLTFTDQTLAAGEYAVIVKDMAAFQLRYGSDTRVLGEFATGQLNNGGERLALSDPRDELVFEFSYGDDDPWPESADGVGATLVLIAPATTAPTELGKPYRWRGSAEPGGSPGRADAAPAGRRDQRSGVESCGERSSLDRTAQHVGRQRRCGRLVLERRCGPRTHVPDSRGHRLAAGRLYPAARVAIQFDASEPGSPRPGTEPLSGERSLVGQGRCDGPIGRLRRRCPLAGGATR